MTGLDAFIAIAAFVAVLSAMLTVFVAVWLTMARQIREETEETAETQQIGRGHWPADPTMEMITLDELLLLSERLKK